jgi:hypothetical protein
MAPARPRAGSAPEYPKVSLLSYQTAMTETTNLAGFAGAVDTVAPAMRACKTCEALHRSQSDGEGQTRLRFQALPGSSVHGDQPAESKLPAGPGGNLKASPRAALWRRGRAGRCHTSCSSNDRTPPSAKTRRRHRYLERLAPCSRSLSRLWFRCSTFRRIDAFGGMRRAATCGERHCKAPATPLAADDTRTALCPVVVAPRWIDTSTPYPVRCRRVDDPHPAT